MYSHVRQHIHTYVSKTAKTKRMVKNSTTAMAAATRSKCPNFMAVEILEAVDSVKRKERDGSRVTLHPQLPLARTL